MRTVILVLLALVCVVTAQQWKRAGTTRYWDCSKPHCAWHGKIPDTNPPFSHDYAFKRCNGRCALGAKYYGTAAAATSIMGGSNQATAACGKCYALRAVGTSTPQLIVKVNNLCPGDTNEKCRRDHFDIAVPGFDWNAFSVSNTCRQNDQSINYINGEQACMRTDPRSCNCDRVSSSPRLVEGCKLFSELGWNNQEVDYTEVPCPNLAGGPVSQPPSNPTPRPTPPPSGRCSGVAPAFDPSSLFWIELHAPSSVRSVQVVCTGGNSQTISCEKKWGKWVGKPNGACAPDSQSPRYAIIDGARCRLSGPARAEYEEDSTFSEDAADTAVIDTFVADSNVDSALADTNADTFVADTNVDAALADTNVEIFVADTNVADTVVDTNVADTNVDAASADLGDFLSVDDVNVEETVLADNVEAEENVVNDNTVADAAVADLALDASYEVENVDFAIDAATDPATGPASQTSSIPAWGIAVIVVCAITLLAVVFLTIFVVLRGNTSSRV